MPAAARGSAPVRPRHGADEVVRPLPDALPDPLRDPLPDGPVQARPAPGKRRGRFLTTVGVSVLTVCWLVWTSFTLLHGAPLSQPLFGLALGLVAVTAAFWGSRLIGRLFLRSRQRAGALPSHVVAAGFAVLCGLAFLSVTPFSIQPLEEFLLSLLPF
jgi:hypothetical protein